MEAGIRGDNPVDHALDEFSTGLDHLVKAVEDGGLDHFDDHELTDFLQRLERVRNRLPLVDHPTLADADRRQLAGRFLHRSLGSLLSALLRISPGEAARRVRTSQAFGARTSMLGEELEPRRPTLAAAQRDGSVTPDQVDIVERALDHIEKAGASPDDLEWAEQKLTGDAQTFGPADLRKIAVRLVDAADPDGTRPDDQVRHDRRFLHLTQRKDGSYRLEGRLTGAAGAQLAAVLSPLAKPRSTDVPSASGTTKPEPDERSYEQRMHDALEEACARLLRVGGLPASGGTPATVIVLIDLDDLRHRTGHADTSDGGTLSVEEVLRMAGEAEIVTAVCTASGEVLTLGRTRRLASTSQTYALIARDGGCSFPGCTHPPEWCDRHHIVDWLRGGNTDLDNLTLLCRYHHTHFLQRGWECRINPDGNPEWIPPRWQDKHQRPLINDRIRRRFQGRATSSAKDTSA